jgi:alkane 1-monooxygenase
MIYFTLATVGVPLSLFLFFGFKVMMAHFLIASFSVIYLEAINYIEHYGLQRKKLEDGTFENVNITHSWNAPHRFSNYILFKLQRHSDHHENSLKPYQTLCTYDQSPELPNGYAVCLILAFFPSVWFEVMNPLVAAFKDGGKPTQEVKEKTAKVLMSFIVKLNLFLITLVFLGHSF